MAHRYIIGGSGSGKSTLLKQLALKDIKDGHAVVFIDPHGIDVDELMSYTPRKRIKDTVLFDPDFDLIWNPLLPTDNPSLATTSLSNAIKDAWGYHGMVTPVMDMYLYFTIATLMDNKRTLYDSLCLLTQERLPVTDTVLEMFWSNYEKMTPKEQRDATSSTINKLFTLLADTRIRRLLSHRKSHLTMSDIVKDKIFYVRLPQGQLGLSKVSLIGSIILSLMHVASLSRDPAIPLSIYIDELHHFSHSTIAEMLSGLRKFNVHLTVAHQFIDQLDRELFGSLMGNCATRHIFRVSEEDAKHFQDCKRNGPICLHELTTFQYRTFPWYPTHHDQYATPLQPPMSDMTDRVKTHTFQNYCRSIG